MEESSKLQSIIKKSIVFFVFILFLAVIGTTILKYNIEGEKNMPFNLSKIFIISSAEGVKKDELNESNWNVDVYQTNDIYLNITKNKNYKDEEIIKSLQIKNIEINNKPQIGDINIFIPKDSDKDSEKFKGENKIDNDIEYVGDIESDIGNFKISNQGGTLFFSVVNITGKSFESDDDVLKHDGTLLEKANISNEEIKFNISFDIVINLESEISYTGKVNLELPIDNVVSKGVTSFDKEETKDIIFKRN